ncbi:glycosyltransferase involved in cell wall biosynthesis [Methylobacterium sp. B4]|nr:glycosyltransferase involved in cell wall biosynthesis [Methylobacterium sp. B4]
MKIALVTEELANFSRSGGIGAAIFELAISLAKKNHEVDIHFYPTDHVGSVQEAQNYFRNFAVNVIQIEGGKYVFNLSAAECRSYAVYRHLADYEVDYDFVHFHDYKGLGFFSCAAKHQRIDFKNTKLIVQLHGPTRWTVHANRALFSHIDQLKIDHLEKESIRLADHVVSPSAYLIEWLKNNDFTLPQNNCVHVIKNVYEHCERIARRTNINYAETVKIKEIVFFGRHEARKGIVTFCNALDMIASKLEAQDITVSFVGGFGEINGRPSGVYLTERSKKWSFPFTFHVGMERSDAIQFLKDRKCSLVVIPSSAENSPYTVAEAIAAGCPILTSLDGGAKELIDAAQHKDTVVATEDTKIAQALLRLMHNGAPVPRFAEAPTAVAHKWNEFHSNLGEASQQQQQSSAKIVNPKVVVGITHFNRPKKALAAIMSVLRQTYDNIELILVDDGSNSPDTIAALPHIKGLLSRVGGRFITRENGYLGAARNTIVKESESDYILFLDDDDILLPEAVETFVSVALATKSDITNCLNVFMDISVRNTYELAPEEFVSKVSYVPSGGPLSVSHLSNAFGAATALIKRSLMEDLGGYTELKGVGYEDYEFYVRAAQAGANIQIVPRPLYLYEVGRPSMINSTSFMSNKLRVVEALDFSRNLESWRDAIEVSAGAEAVTDQSNSWSWAISISPHRSLLQSIVATTGNISEHVKALTAYARAIDSPAAAAAWERSLIRTACTESTLAERPAASIAASDAALELNAVDLIGQSAEIIALLKLGRVNSIVELLLKKVDTGDELETNVVELLYVLARSRQIDGTSAARLIASLMNVSVPSQRLAEIRGLIATIAINARIFSVAKEQLAALQAFESKIYIAANPDLSEGYKDRALAIALEHFDDHGRKEGRHGFQEMQRVAQAVSAFLQRSIRLRQLAEQFDETFVEPRSTLRAATS